MVVKAQAVNECLPLWQTKHAGFWIACLRFGGYGAHLHEAKPHVAKGVNAARFLVQTGGQTNAIGKVQARQRYGVRHPGLRVGHAQGSMLRRRQARQGEIVCRFSIEAE